ncbi:hypothetical protein FACS1894156_4220 [Bacteroidia bacterium]|nr:hypothetical protein FACS1894156_4220 [Bacteroidia bacterium]
MAYNLLKYLRFVLSGGLPSTSRYEQKQLQMQQNYERYQFLAQSESLKRYSELAAQVATPRSQSGLSKKEWKQIKQNFSTLQKSQEVSQFFRLQKQTKNFKEVAAWKQTFFDNFTAPALDDALWVNRCPTATPALPHINYSLAEEWHLFTENGNNVQCTGDTLQLITQKEQAAGIVFSKELGFIPAERNFTSGIVNTDQKYRVQYGKIEAKIKFQSASKYVFHAVWMAAGGQLPHINLLRIGQNIEMSSFAKSDRGALQYVDLWGKILRQNTFYIIQLLWNEDKITWSINGRPMFSAPCTIHQPLFLAFSSGILGGEPRTEQPSSLVVDWVKVSQPTTPTPSAN